MSSTGFSRSTWPEPYGIMCIASSFLAVKGVLQIVAGINFILLNHSFKFIVRN